MCNKVHELDYITSVTNARCDSKGLKYMFAMIRNVYSSIFVFHIEEHVAYVFFFCLYSREI